MAAQTLKIWRGIHPLIKVTMGVIAVAVLGFGIWAAAPLFYDRQVDEDFPLVSAPAAPVVESDAAAAPMVEPAIDEPEAVAAPVETQPEAQPVAPAAAPDAPAEVAATNVPTEPIALRSGNFTHIDALHSAEGTATLYELPDGTRILRLEDFQSTNGPDLFIGLSGHPMPRSSAELHDQGYVELEPLKGNQGNQNYVIPPDLDLSLFQSVTIYCRAFGTMFSSAALDA